MSTKTFTVSKQYMASSNTGDANPGDLHIPIGDWLSTGWHGRAVLYAPISFSGMVSINAARLYMRAHAPSSGWHAQGSSTASIYATRKTADWSETSGGVSSAVNELWGGNGSSVINASYVATQLGDLANLDDLADGVWYYITITEIVQDWFNGSPNYGTMIYNATSESSPSYAKEFYSRHQSGSQPYMWVDYETNTPPNAPVSLSPTGNAVRHTGTNIVVSGTRSDPDAGDYITGYQVQMFDDAVNTLVDSAVIYPGGAPTTFSTTLTVPSGNNYYQWNVRTRDKNNVWGPYSALQRFKANAVPNAPIIAIGQSPTNDIKTLTPTLLITRSDPDAGDHMSAYTIDLETSAGAQVWNSGDVAVSAGTTTATRAYNGPALAWGSSYRWRARTQDSNGAFGTWSNYASFTTHKTGVPISLEPSGNGVTSSLTPTLTGSRASTADAISSWQIQVFENDGVTLKWDSGFQGYGVSGGATFSVPYSGAALSYSTAYKWRALLVSNIGGMSSWSALQQFTALAANTVVQTAPIGGPITDITPTFSGTWSDNLNGYQIILYAENGTTVIWDSTMLSQTSAASFSKVYNGPALDWNTSYKWKGRVRRTADNVVQNYSGLAAFSTSVAGQPTLISPIDDDWWLDSIAVYFQGNTFGTETISTYRILLYEADGETLTWDSGNLAGSGTSFGKDYNGPELVNGRTYKWQASYIRSDGVPGNYSAIESFHLNAVPLSPSNLSPETGAIIVDSLLPEFSATFEDIDIVQWSDSPTELEIRVYDNDTSALIATQSISTGLISGENSMAWDGVPVLEYENTYKWRARYYDFQGQAGAWSSYNTFKPSQSSNVVIDAPIGTIVSPSVDVQWTFTSPSGKSQGSYQVQVFKNDDDTLVYDSGTVLSSDNTHHIPGGYLVNDTPYTFKVITLDVEGV